MLHSKGGKKLYADRKSDDSRLPCNIAVSL